MGGSIIKPVAPHSFANAACLSASLVEPSAIFIITGILSFTFSTANFTSVSFSKTVSTLASPSVPPRTIPFTPADN